MTWDDIIGQERAVRLLRAAVASQRVAHAYLFTGPRGTGKRDAAMTLAAALNCDRAEGGEPCGACCSCVKMRAGHHPDLLLVSPPGKEILIWQIVPRDESGKQGVMPVRSFVALRPGEGRRKVIILDGADRLRQEAANALLKTLEEPPDYAVLILVTANPSGVLDTIRSRCQTISFAPVPTHRVAERLQQEGMDAGQARLVAAVSGGSLGRARLLAQEADLAEQRERARRLLAELPALNDADALDRSEGLDSPQRQQVVEFLDLLLLWLRDALVWGQTRAPDLVAATAETAFLDEVAHRHGPGGLMSMIDAVRAAQSALDRNVPARLALDVMMVKLVGRLT